MGHAQLGTTQGVRVGQSVFAIGAAGGSHTLSAGVVSGLKRSIPSLTGRIITGAVQVSATS